MIRAVLWDIDGTLLDSEPHHFAAIADVCARHGHTLSQADYDRLLGRSMPEVYALLNAVEPMPFGVAGFARACTARYVEAVASVRSRPGALERVDWLAAHEVPQACVSNSGRTIVDANMDRMARASLAFAVSRDDVVHGKPHPEPYLAAAARLGLDPSACLVVEDSPVGVRSARAAGMVTIAWPQVPELDFGDAAVVADLDALDWAELLGWP